MKQMVEYLPDGRVRASVLTDDGHVVTSCCDMDEAFAVREAKARAEDFAAMPPARHFTDAELRGLKLRGEMARGQRVAAWIERQRWDVALTIVAAAICVAAFFLYGE